MSSPRLSMSTAQFYGPKCGGVAALRLRRRLLRAEREAGRTAGSERTPHFSRGTG